MQARAQMRSHLFLFASAGVVLCLALLLGVPSVAGAAQARLEVARTPQSIADVTVNIYCRLVAGKKIYGSSGRGVLIDPRGVILTNAHVAQYFLLAKDSGRVEGRCSVRQGSPARDRYTAQVLYLPASWLIENASKISEREPRGTGENDFALLYITGAQRGTLSLPFPFLPIETLVERWLPVSVAGYPTQERSFSEVRSKLTLAAASSSVSNVLSYAGGFTDLLALTSSARAQSGVSGGPVVSPAGALLGIVAAKSLGETASLRALTLSYVDRAVTLQTGLTLAELLAGDFALRAQATAASIPPEALSALERGLRAKK
jgi:hypothetical protein